MYVTVSQLLPRLLILENSITGLFEGIPCVKQLSKLSPYLSQIKNVRADS